MKLREYFSGVELGNRHVDPDILGQAHKYIVRQFADTAGKKGGEFYTPKEVARTIVKTLDHNESDEVYDLVCGSGGMLIQGH